MEQTASKFGGIDIVINNVSRFGTTSLGPTGKNRTDPPGKFFTGDAQKASAISLTTSDKTSMTTYDLMNSINSRGTYLVTKASLPYPTRDEESTNSDLAPILPTNPTDRCASPPRIRQKGSQP